MPAKILENLSLFLLIALAALRPIISERYDSGTSGFGMGVTGIADPSPLTTVIFDVLILVAAILCAWARAIRKDRRYRWTGLELGTVVVMMAGVASCFFASNGRLALNATIDWVCLPIATITLAQLLQSRWRRQLVIMVVLASACVQVWQIFDYRISGLEATWEQYLAGKEAFWQNRGVSLDSPSVILFEHRIQADEAQGFFPHSNVASSYLVLCFLVALGVAVDLWRRVKSSADVVTPLAISALGAATLVSILFTKSLGGFVSLGVGILLLAAMWVLHRWIAANRRKAFALGWVGLTVGIVAVVGHGTFRGTLPGGSLNFRWQYWTASAEMIADHPITGVGRENFGRNYLAYKSIESSEEVANPHNLFVQVASDWGLPGLAGILVMCVGVTCVLSRRTDGDHEEKTEPPGAGHSLPLRQVLPWAIGGLATVTAGRIALLGSDNANWVYYQTMTTGIAWLIGFFVVAATFWSLSQTATRDRCLGWESFVSVGLFAFLLHELVNFAMFVPGSAYTFFVLLAIPIATHAPRKEMKRGTAGWFARWTPVLGGSLLLMAVGFSTLMPVANADHHLQLSRTATGTIISDNISKHPAADHCELAAIFDPIDPTPLADRARWMMGVASIEALRRSALRQAEHSLDQAIHRDPKSIQLRRQRLRLYLLQARESKSSWHYDQAIEAANEVLELYPQSPADLVALANAQLESAQLVNRPGLGQEAVETYRRAIALDNERPEWETFQRLQPPQRERIKAKIIEAQELAVK